MPAMLQEGDYPFPQEASLPRPRGEASAAIAIWSVPERRPEHEFKSAFSTHSLKLALNSNDKLQTPGREARLRARSLAVRCKRASGGNRKIRMGNTVSYGTMRFQFPHIAAGVVMQPLVSRYYTTVPIHP